MDDRNTHTAAFVRPARVRSSRQPALLASLALLLCLLAGQAVMLITGDGPAASADRASAARLQADRFALQDAHDGITISYSTTGFDGRPQLSYRDAKKSASFAGKEIRTASTEIGTLVSVTLEAVADLRTVTLTIVLPSINLPDTGKAAFATTAIVTTARTTIGGPGLVKGAVQTYRTLALKGNAEYVLF